MIRFINLTVPLAEEIIQVDNITFGEGLGLGLETGEWRDLVIEAEAITGTESSYTNWLRRTA